MSGAGGGHRNTVQRFLPFEKGELAFDFYRSGTPENWTLIICHSYFLQVMTLVCKYYKLNGFPMRVSQWSVYLNMYSHIGFNDSLQRLLVSVV